MKVLSLREPWASLVSEKKKLIETRSWNTKYRGTLYIHSSGKSVSNTASSEVLSLVNSNNYNFGHIICKCELVDTVYMTKKFIDNLKKNNYQEYICGEYKEGRYAWILENIENLDKPIEAKGKLGIWNYDETKCNK